MIDQFDMDNQYMCKWNYDPTDLQQSKMKSSLAHTITAQKYSEYDDSHTVMRIRNLGYQCIIMGIVDDHQSEQVENDFKRHAVLHGPGV